MIKCNNTKNQEGIWEAREIFAPERKSSENVESESKNNPSNKSIGKCAP